MCENDETCKDAGKLQWAVPCRLNGKQLAATFVYR